MVLNNKNNTYWSVLSETCQLCKYLSQISPSFDIMNQWHSKVSITIPVLMHHLMFY